MDVPYKVVIAASGVGSALGDFIQHTNKALIRVGRKPVISYIVEAYPKDIPIVVTLGYKGDLIKEFLLMAYPGRVFEFVDVDLYEGEGSSLGYSLSKAKNALQCPFIYQAVDTIVLDTIGVPTHNWIAGCKTQELSNYAELTVVGSTVTRIKEKGAAFAGWAHVGLVGIHDYAAFWETLETLLAKSAHAPLGDAHVVSQLLAEGKEFTLVPVERWLDTGNIVSLKHAREQIPDAFENLDKLDEAIYLFDDHVIKFFANAEVAGKRAERAKLLAPLVPPLEAASAHFYRYAYVKGDLYSKVVTPEDVGAFLSWAKEYLWQPRQAVDDTAFAGLCLKFYLDKTRERVQRFLEQTGIHDAAIQINGVNVPGALELIAQIDPNWFSKGEQTIFHGDCILENIIKTPTGYALIDWRQDFAGLLEAGDCYYDLAKFHHNLIVNHEIISRDLFEVRETETGVWCDIMRPQNMVEVQNAFLLECQQRGFDVLRIRRLSAIIWLNMAPLHHHPFDRFLYYFGRLQLWKSLSPHA